MPSILVTGLKGGVGRTTVAESLSYVAKEEGLCVEVIDANARLNCDLRSKMKKADLALIVVEAGVFGQLDISFLAAELLKDGNRSIVLVNKSREQEDAGLMDLLRELDLQYAGAIPFNRYFAYMLGEGAVLAKEDRNTYALLKEILLFVAQEEA